MPHVEKVPFPALQVFFLCDLIAPPFLLWVFCDLITPSFFALMMKYWISITGYFGPKWHGMLTFFTGSTCAECTAGKYTPFIGATGWFILNFNKFQFSS